MQKTGFAITKKNMYISVHLVIYFTQKTYLIQIGEMHCLLLFNFFPLLKIGVKC